VSVPVVVVSGPGRRIGLATFTDLTTSSLTVTTSPSLTKELRTDQFVRDKTHALSIISKDAEALAYTDGLDASGDYQIFADVPVGRASQSIEVASQTNTTISTAGTGGWQTVTLDLASHQNSVYTDLASDYDKINIQQPDLPTSVTLYASAALTGVSGSPFTAQLRIRDTENSETLHETGPIHINQDSDVTLKLGQRVVDLTDPDSFRGLKLQVNQDSGGDVTVVGDSDETYLGVLRN